MAIWNTFSQSRLTSLGSEVLLWPTCCSVRRKADIKNEPGYIVPVERIRLYHWVGHSCGMQSLSLWLVIMLHFFVIDREHTGVWNGSWGLWKQLWFCLSVCLLHISGCPLLFLYPGRCIERPEGSTTLSFWRESHADIDCSGFTCVGLLARSFVSALKSPSAAPLLSCLSSLLFTLQRSESTRSVGISLHVDPWRRVFQLSGRGAAERNRNISEETFLIRLIYDYISHEEVMRWRQKSEAKGCITSARFAFTSRSPVTALCSTA